MLSSVFARTLRDDNIMVNACHPGDSDTQLSRDLGALSRSLVNSRVIDEYYCDQLVDMAHPGTCSNIVCHLYLSNTQRGGEYASSAHLVNACHTGDSDTPLLRNCVE